ncbi:hypothetical protein [Zhongshania sp.]|uniref:hypothetical protein n=1 Tax=Zhongshania sp. TaxID=1971902 RepID=UPI0035689E97
MDELINVITKEFLSVDYGNIEGFKPRDDIKLASLIRLKAAVEIAIHYELQQEADS